MDAAHKQFTCYFCKKVISNDTEMAHVAVCANVLVPCSNKCGSYVSRLELPIHKKMCVNQGPRKPPKMHKYQSDMHLNKSPNTASLDRNGQTNQTVNSLKAQITNLSQKLSNYEHQIAAQSIKDTSSVIASLQTDGVKQQTELHKIRYQIQILLEWRKSLDLQIDTLKQNIHNLHKYSDEKEKKISALDALSSKFKELHNENTSDINTMLEEQAHLRNFANEINGKLETFRDYYAEESITVAQLWKDHTRDIDLLKTDFHKIKTMLDEQKAKIASIVFDCRTVSQIASDAADRIELQERQSERFKNDINQMKLDMEILENLINAVDITNHTGNFLWKITDVQSKLEQVKETNSVLKSPIFYTDTYGYKVRIILYLNGMKKWKGRYALLSLHVMKGEYDLMLKWPCHIEGNVTLRDLENSDEEQQKHFSKYILAKRETANEENEEPQESSSSYIFIPHTILFKEKYMKEDTLFLQFTISNKIKRESSL